MAYLILILPMIEIQGALYHPLGVVGDRDNVASGSSASNAAKLVNNWLYIFALSPAPLNSLSLPWAFWLNLSFLGTIKLHNHMHLRPIVCFLPN